MDAPHHPDLVTLERLQESDLAEFARALQEAFTAGAQEAFGQPQDELIPSLEDVYASCQTANAVSYRLLRQGRPVGGAVLIIDDQSGHNSLDFFFISPQAHGRGLGTQAWQAIERAYPQTRVWETHTPYFEKRNIHFYLNKCGFKIVEFYHHQHPGPHREEQSGPEMLDEMFRFEKRMDCHD